MSTFTQKIVLFTAIAVWVLGYNLWQFAWHNFYYHCVAVTWLLLFILVKDLVKDKWLKIIANIGILISVNNLLDEMFFNPNSTDINEYIFCLIGTIIILINGTIRRKRVNG